MPSRLRLIVGDNGLVGDLVQDFHPAHAVILADDCMLEALSQRDARFVRAEAAPAHLKFPAVRLDE